MDGRVLSDKHNHPTCWGCRTTGALEILIQCHDQRTYAKIIDARSAGQMESYFVPAVVRRRKIKGILQAYFIIERLFRFRPSLSRHIFRCFVERS